MIASKSIDKQSENNGHPKTGGVANLKPFKKGQSGNPRGRPKKNLCIPDILNKITDEELPPAIRAKMAVLFPDISNRPSVLEAIMRVVVQRAMKGEQWAVEFIAQRTEGKVKENIAVSGGGTLTIIEQVVTRTKK